MVILSGIVSCTVVEDEDIETRDAPPGCQPDVLYIGDVGASAGGSDDFVAKFDAHDGEFLGYLVPPGSSFLNGPAGIIVDKTNQVVLVDQNIGEMRSSEIWKLKPFGKPPEQLLVAPESGTPLDPPDEPWAARGVIQIENVLYVVDVGITDNTGRITLWDSKSGDYLGDLPFDGYNGWKAPRSIVLGPDGYIYVSNTNIDADAPMGTPPTLGGSILRFDPVTGFDKVVYECYRTTSRATCTGPRVWCSVPMAGSTSLAFVVMPMTLTESSFSTSKMASARSPVRSRSTRPARLVHLPR
jgi:hypothetical protein